MKQDIKYVFASGKLQLITLDEKVALNKMNELYELNQYSSPHIEYVEFDNEDITLMSVEDF